MFSFNNYITYDIDLYYLNEIYFYIDVKEITSFRRNSRLMVHTIIISSHSDKLLFYHYSGS